MESNMIEDDTDNLEPVIEINNLDQSNKNNKSLDKPIIKQQLTQVNQSDSLLIHNLS